MNINASQFIKSTLQNQSQSFPFTLVQYPTASSKQQLHSPHNSSEYMAPGKKIPTPSLPHSIIYTREREKRTKKKVPRREVGEYVTVLRYPREELRARGRAVRAAAARFVNAIPLSSLINFPKCAPLFTRGGRHSVHTFKARSERGYKNSICEYKRWCGNNFPYKARARVSRCCFGDVQ